MEKGILLEMEGGKAVILTPQGEFKRIPIQPGAWEIGDEITTAVTLPAVPWFRWRWAPTAVVAAAAALMLLLMPIGYQAWALAQPFAIVTLDINPSVQLTLNERDEVLKVEALNEDGKAIIRGVDWKRHPVGEVLEMLTTKAVEAGKLNPADAESVVVVAVAPATQKDLTKSQSTKLVQATRQGVDNALVKESAKKHVESKTQVATLTATAQEREEASQEGLDVGKLLLKKELEAKKPELKPEQVTKQLHAQGPGQVLKELKVDFKEFLKDAEREHSPKQEETKGSEKQDTGEPARPVAGKAEQNPAGGKNDKETPKKDTPPGQDTAKDSDEKAKSQEKDKARDKEKSQEKDMGGGNKVKAKGSSSESWKIPLFGITIPKPQLFRSDKETQPPQADPRAQSSGAGPSEAEGRGQDAAGQAEAVQQKPAAGEDRPAAKQEKAVEKAEVKSSDSGEVKPGKPESKSRKSEPKTDKGGSKSD